MYYLWLFWVVSDVFGRYGEIWSVLIVRGVVSCRICLYLGQILLRDVSQFWIVYQFLLSVSFRGFWYLSYLSLFFRFFPFFFFFFFPPLQAINFELFSGLAVHMGDETKGEGQVRKLAPQNSRKIAFPSSKYPARNLSQILNHRSSVVAICISPPLMVGGAYVFDIFQESP